MKSEFLRAARLQRVCGTIFFLGLLLLLFQHTAEATTWTVTSTEDRSYDPPEGTLRHAVQNAWNNDIIVFASSGMEIQLAEELPIGKNVTIMGSSTTVRQTAPHHRVFSVASGAFVRMEHLTITGGKGYSGGAGGGGILNRGYLTLYRCTLRDNYASTYGGSIENYGDLTLNIVTLENNTAAHQGGGICNRMGGTLNAYTSTIRNNTSEGYGGGLTNFGTANLLSHTDFSGNTANRGGGIYNDGEITTSWCTLSSNQASESSAGGGIENYGSLTLAENSAVTGNTPLEILGNYTTDGTCTIGTSPGRSSVALAGMASGSSPKARSTAGEPDVIAAEENLGNSGSSLYGEVKEALSGDLRGISGNLSASLEEMDATLYNAFTYENVPLADTSGEGELEIEFTASWPRCVRYYAAFALAEEDAANDESAKTLVPGNYVLPERGIQFEIQPGQNLPEGVTPPEFYESGEGLRTWRNTVADNGSFDLDPETGTVTFRICSVRAEAQAPASGGSSGGCNAGGDGASWLSFLLLLGLPLMGGLRKKYEKSSETKREGEICMCEKRGKRTCSFLILSVLMLLGFFIFQDAAHATTWIVTSEADDEARETLRHAVENAAGGDTVSIRVPVVNLRSFLFVNKNLTISGYPSATLRQTVAGERVAYFIPGITCTLNGLTITGGDLSGSSLCGAGLINHGTLTMRNCTVTNNTEGGGILNAGNLTMHDCTVSNNTANWPRRAAGINNEASGSSAPVLTMYNCVVKENENYDTAGGGILNGEVLYMYGCTVENNKSKGSGGGLLLNLYTETYLAQGTRIMNNTPDQVAGSGTYSTDGNCFIGIIPGRSSVALAGMASGSSPEPRSTAGDSDVTAAEEDLNNSDSALYGEVKEALSGDLQGISGNLSASLEGMNATLYNAFTYENVPLEDASGNGELEIEFTASWPRYVRYYAAFALAEEDTKIERTLVPGKYILPERGILFEIQPGQDLPKGATPPDFYEPGEGLRTWRNTVADNGSFDLNPEEGVVTFRICSVRAEAQAPASGGSSGGCNAGATSGLSLLLLLGLPLKIALNKKKWF